MMNPVNGVVRYRFGQSNAVKLFVMHLTSKVQQNVYLNVVLMQPVNMQFITPPSVIFQVNVRAVLFQLSHPVVIPITVQKIKPRNAITITL